MAAGALVLSVYCLIFDQGAVQWNWLAAGYLLYNGVLASALAFFLWNYILSNTEAGKAAISVLVIPIVGVLAGVILLKEPLHWNTITGIVMILAGIWLVKEQSEAPY
ncbi:MAG: EamA family transporter [Firmicutes bacterium]|nr:EamA family transporter [Bacillota bacterium]